MIILETVADARQLLPCTTHPRVLVPTMGALHDGHFSLIRQARSLAGDSGQVVVSIFVNPIQFDRKEDLDSYPNTLQQDLDACKELGVDAVFTPEVPALYAPDRSITVSETALANTLCGATRPGHFDGVCTVVLKLFNIIQPDSAVFGKKDFQQLAIIRRMVRDLDVPVEIYGGETVRESDGLALSSRNLRLTPESRAEAPTIRKGMEQALSLSKNGETSTQTLLNAVRETLSACETETKIDYLECVDADNLQPVESLTRPAIIAIAIFFGEVRLIDNIELFPPNA